MSLISYCFEFCRAPTLAPTSGLSLKKMAPTLAKSNKIGAYHFLYIVWVGESDSDFILTIWHKSHPHSGVKVIFQKPVHLFNNIILYRFSAFIVQLRTWST